VAGGTNKQPVDFAVLAEVPAVFTDSGGMPTFNVGYHDGTVKQRATAFCSHNALDSIFAPEPGWAADTDSYIRVSE
jgi:hypothetical protein